MRAPAFARRLLIHRVVLPWLNLAVAVGLPPSLCKHFTGRSFTLEENQPSQEFLDLVDEMTAPRPSPSATIRVAEVHFGGAGLAPAIEAAGMSIVASLDGTRDLPNFGMMPEFDLVITDVPPTENGWTDAIQFLLRFLRVRRPVAFVVFGCTEEMFRIAMTGASRPYGYTVSISRQDGLGFIAGISEREPEEETWEKIDEVVMNIRGRLNETDR